MGRASQSDTIRSWNSQLSQVTSLTWLGRLVEAPSDKDWEQLNSVYSPLVSAWVQRAGVAESDRDDLVQEVLVVVVRRVSDFQHQHPGSFRGWLRSILANLLKAYFRTQAAHPCEFPLEDLADPKSVLSQHLDREHDEHLARMALQLAEPDFSSETWTAFRRQVLEGYSATTVAKDLGITLNAALKARSRVLIRLREKLERLCHADFRGG